MNSENFHNKKEPIVENKNLLSYPTRTLDPHISIIDRAKEIELAEDFIKSHVNSKLEIILKQIRNLQDEAKLVIEQAAIDADLHKVKCNFEKKIGQVIHLYLKESTGEKYFSLISVEEWGKPPHQFLGSYKLNPD